MNNSDKTDETSDLYTDMGPLMRSQLERYRLLLENSRDVVVEVAGDGRLVYVSPNAKKVLGYEPASLFHTRMLENIHPEDFVHVRDQINHPEGVVTCRYRHGDGSWRWLETTGREFISPDSQVRCVLVVRDITERKHADGERLKLEAHLRQIHKMEALGTLAGGIAHDFNNLLTVIIGCTELAMMDVHNPVEAVKHLKQVEKAGKHSKELVQQILTFSRKQKQERKPLRLQTVINDSLDLMRHTLPSTVEIVTQVDPDVPVVMADPTQMHQVMVNLCTNASHAMGQRPGRITVTLSVCGAEIVQAKAIAIRSCRRYVQLAVSDSGHGMDSATIAQIFEPFFTTKKPDEGTGLGLSVVKGIVLEHEGAITVHSRIGIGTTLEIYLPVLDIAPPDHKVVSSPLPRGNGEHILLVDDEPAVCVALRVLLEHLGYRVTEMTDPTEAIKIIGEMPDHFDLLISDMTMPRMTGTDLVRLILEIRPLLPVVITSGSPGATLDQVKEFGVCELLTKPVTLTALAKVVDDALNASKAG